MGMRINARKEMSTMAELNIVGPISVPPSIIGGTNLLSISVSTTTDADTFNEEISYQLVVL